MQTLEQRPRTLNFSLTFSEAMSVGIKNVPSILGCIILFLLTCWIPYINIGTAIALTMLPVQLAKGEVINPLSIFSSRYRRYIGEYILTYGLMGIGILYALVLFIIPGFVVAISWSLSLYFLLDRKMNPLQAIKASNDATYGSKWLIFLAKFALALCFMVVNMLIVLIFGDNGFTLILLLFVLIIESSIGIAVDASIWKQLNGNVQ
uniref:hypothetical protein n=1 Tax=Alistipes sp. TaxID=1872444 RepID=UPI004055FD0C